MNVLIFQIFENYSDFSTLIFENYSVFLLHIFENYSEDNLRKYSKICVICVLSKTICNSQIFRIFAF